MWQIFSPSWVGPWTRSFCGASIPCRLHPEDAVADVVERRARARAERQAEDVTGVARVDHAVVPQPRGGVVRVALALVLLPQGRADLGLADGLHHRRGLDAAHDADARVRPHEQEAR